MYACVCTYIVHAFICTHGIYMYTYACIHTHIHAPLYLREILHYYTRSCICICICICIHTQREKERIMFITHLKPLQPKTAITDDFIHTHVYMDARTHLRAKRCYNIAHAFNSDGCFGVPTIAFYTPTKSFQRMNDVSKCLVPTML